MMLLGALLAWLPPARRFCFGVGVGMWFSAGVLDTRQVLSVASGFSPSSFTSTVENYSTASPVVVAQPDKERRSSTSLSHSSAASSISEGEKQVAKVEKGAQAKTGKSDEPSSGPSIDSPSM